MWGGEDADTHACPFGGFDGVTRIREPGIRYKVLGIRYNLFIFNSLIGILRIFRIRR